MCSRILKERLPFALKVLDSSVLVYELAGLLGNDAVGVLRKRGFEFHLSKSFGEKQIPFQILPQR